MIRKEGKIVKLFGHKFIFVRANGCTSCHFCNTDDCVRVIDKLQGCASHLVLKPLMPRMYLDYKDGEVISFNNHLYEFTPAIELAFCTGCEFEKTDCAPCQSITCPEHLILKRHLYDFGD